jgi:hypothetical protein
MELVFVMFSFNGTARFFAFSSIIESTTEKVFFLPSVYLSVLVSFPLLVYLTDCPSILLSICPSVLPCTHLSPYTDSWSEILCVCLPVCFCVHLSVFRLSKHLCVCIFILPSVCPSICPCVYLYFPPYVYLFFKK